MRTNKEVVEYVKSLLTEQEFAGLAGELHRQVDRELRTADLKGLLEEKGVELTAEDFGWLFDKIYRKSTAYWDAEQFEADVDWWLSEREAQKGAL